MSHTTCPVRSTRLVLLSSMPSTIQGVGPPADATTIHQPPQQCQGPGLHSVGQYGLSLTFQVPPGPCPLALLLPLFLLSEGQAPSDAGQDFHALVLILALITSLRRTRPATGSSPTTFRRRRRHSAWASPLVRPKTCYRCHW